MDYEKQGFVSVWIGDVPETSRELFRCAWLEEDFRSEEDSPTYGRSSFMDAYQTGWIDHDFQEFHFFDAPVSVSDLLEHATFAESYRGPVLDRVAELGIATGNVLLLVLDFAYLEPAGDKLDGLALKFVGAFPYEKTFF